VTALQNKNPVARQGTLQFLARALQNTRDAPTKSDLDVIAPASETLSSPFGALLRKDSVVCPRSLGNVR
jgi:hypothetical protein